jgi:hypothetical protein
VQSPLQPDVPLPSAVAARALLPPRFDASAPIAASNPLSDPIISRYFARKRLNVLGSAQRGLQWTAALFVDERSDPAAPGFAVPNIRAQPLSRNSKDAAAAINVMKGSVGSGDNSALVQRKIIA